MAIDSNVLQEVVDALKQDPEIKNNVYQATVSQIDGEGVVWVNIAGSDTETPTAITSAEVAPGDAVNVEWRNNKLYIGGNYSNPSAGVIRVEAVEAATQVANEAAANAVQSAGEAHAAAEDAKATAESVHGIAVQAGEDAADAQTAAGNAQQSADSALVNLSTVQDVVGVLNWITAHGTMTLTSDVTVNPAHVYFVVDPTGDYVVGGTHYSIVSEPKDAELSTYYELTIDESVQNYVATHIVVDSEGLWIIPDSGGNKVLIATGSGSTYTTAGTYIVGTGGVTLASFTANEAIIGQESEAHAVVNSESMSLILGNGFAPFSVNSGATTSAPKTYKRTFTLTPNGTYQLTLPDTTIISGSNIHLYVLVTISGTTTWKNMDFTQGTSSSQAFGGLGVVYNGARVFRFTETGSSVNWGVEATFTYEISNGTGAYYNIGFRNLSNSIGEFSVAEGYNTTASGDYSHAEGYETTAEGDHSHAEGNRTSADNGGHAEGLNSTATGTNSHAEGVNSYAVGSNAHAEGINAHANGNHSHAQNSATIADSASQTALGKYNVADNSDTYAVIVGNGTADNARSNALTVDWSGNVDIASGAKYKINGNNLSASDVGALAEDANGDISITRNITAGGNVTDGAGNTLSTVASALSSLITTQTYDLGAVSYTAGTIGTVGTTKTTSITKSGYTPIAVSVEFVSTSVVSFIPFMNTGKDTVYTHYVRRQSTAYSTTYHAYLYVTYLKN